MKALLIAIAFVCASAFGYLAYLAHGLGQQGITSATINTFTIATERAIQLSRYGRTFAEWDHNRNIFLTKDIMDDPGLIGCTRPMEVLRITEPYSILSYAILDKKTDSVYLVYPGPPPDFSAVFNNNNARHLFAPQLVTFDGGPSEEILRVDYRDSYDSHISGREFYWESHECDHFTYTVFHEVR